MGFLNSGFFFLEFGFGFGEGRARGFGGFEAGGIRLLAFLVRLRAESVQT